MKNLKYILTATAIFLLLLSLFINSRQNFDNGYTQTEFMLDTECTITVYGNSKTAEKALKAAFDEISRIESLTSLYIEDSDVSKINQSDANLPINIDDTTFEILKSALAISEKSDGAFDITISPVKELWNFKAAATVPIDVDISALLEYVDYKNIQIDANNKTVTKLNPNTKIDLGGIAKGYCGDAVKEVLISHGIECGIIDLGGSITVFGENPNSDDRKWGIGLQTPFEATGTYSKIVRAENCSVVSSGSYERYFEFNNTIYHHILDPKTGYPSKSGINSVSIIHENSTLADALSTACFVLGEEKGTALAESYGAEIYFD